MITNMNLPTHEVIEHVRSLLDLAITLVQEAVDHRDLTQPAQELYVKLATATETARDLSEELDKMGDVNLLVRE